MRTASFNYKAHFIILFILTFALVSQSALLASSIVEFTAIGKIESLYKDRASMKVLYIIASDTEKGIVLAFALWIALTSIACDLLTSY